MSEIVNWMESARNKLLIIDVKRHMPGLRMTLSQDAFGELTEKAVELLDKYVRGNQFLIPKRYCNALERPEVAVRLHLFNTAIKTQFGLAITLDKFEEFTEYFTLQKARFTDVKTELLENYDSLVEEVMNDYFELALDMIKEPGPRQRFLDAIQERIPSPEKIAGYDFKFKLSQLPSVRFDSKVVADLEEYAQTEAAKAAVSFYKENINKQLEEMAAEFFPSVYGQMAEAVRGKLEGYLGRMNKTASIPRGMLVGVRHLVEEVAELNKVIGDPNIGSLLETLNNRVKKSSSDSAEDVVKIKKSLERALDYIEGQEEALEDEDYMSKSQFSFLIIKKKGDK